MEPTFQHVLKSLKGIGTFNKEFVHKQRHYIKKAQREELCSLPTGKYCVNFISASSLNMRSLWRYDCCILPCLNANGIFRIQAIFL